MSCGEVGPLRFTCPHCGSGMKIRTSKQLAPTYRKLYLYCTDEVHCGFRCTGDVTITSTLLPSMSPNPNIENIPLDPSILKALELTNENKH